MIAKVAVYPSHEKALAAVKQLKREKFPINKISIIGKVLMVDNHIHVQSLDTLKSIPLALGVVAGIVIGILTGIGVFAIPGFGALYGAGAVVGAAGGLELGIVGGGLGTLLAHLGIRKKDMLRYEKHLHTGNFLVVVQGEPKEIETAQHILHTEGNHLELN